MQDARRPAEAPHEQGAAQGYLGRAREAADVRSLLQRLQTTLQCDPAVQPLLPWLAWLCCHWLKAPAWLRQQHQHFCIPGQGLPLCWVPGSTSVQML